ncbi:MAG: hypothetical protein AB7F59_12465 [Bdellovibrionales bacterium]
MIPNKSLLIASAIAGLIMSAGQVQASDNEKPKAAVGECHGANACKGQGACGGADHECAGKNSCKGKGFVKLTKKDCAKKGGKFQQAKM